VFSIATHAVGPTDGEFLDRQQGLTGELYIAPEEHLAIPMRKTPNPLKLAQPGKEFSIRRGRVDRRIQGIDPDAENGARRNQLRETATEPFLGKAHYGHIALAIPYTRREGKRY